MNNKRVLQTAVNELDKRKAPKAPKDIIVDPKGQWRHPGEITRIPSNTITMQGVPYPVLGVPNTGEPKMMMPGQYYDFPEADYVDEYPQMRKGGGLNSKKYTRSLEGIGSLFRESDLFKKPKSKKKKYFHPNAKYFQDGGAYYDDSRDAWVYADGTVGPNGPAYQDGGEPGDKFKKRLMKRYPGMQGVYGPEGENLNIVKDPNYDARSVGYGDIEFSFPGDPYLRYDNIIPKDDPNYIDVEEYIYSNIAPDKYNSVYNPRGANRRDVFLDMMHGMRDDPNFQPLLQNFEKAVKDTRGEDMDWQYEGEVENGSTQSKERFDENYVDGQLRAELAPKTIGRFSKGRKDYRMERKYDSPEMRAAAKDIKNYLKTPKEEYIEADLTPEEIQEYAKGGYVIEDMAEYAEGGDPGDITCPPGYVYNPETKYCEQKSGCPDGYTFDAKSGRCVSKYQKESIKVMATPYKYRKDGSVIDFPNEYEDSEFKPISEDQLVYKKSAQNSTWPKDFYVKDVSNPVYFKNSGVVQISTPEFVPEFEGDSEYYISTYPDLNYKVVVDPKKPEGFNKDENIYYVKSENTHQFKKYKEWEKLKALEKENLENAKKHGFILHADPPSYSQKYPDEYYKTSLNKYDENGEKIWAYDEGNYEYKPGWDEKKYRADHKTVQELYNDPEYLGWDAYDKSFDEIFKDRGKKNIETYKERCPDCTYFHGQRMTVDPDYMYDSYNPFQNKVAEGQMTRAFKTLEPDYLDPTAVRQMPTMEEYEYSDMPNYNPVDYEGTGIHPVWSYGHKTRKTITKFQPGRRNSIDNWIVTGFKSKPTRHLRGFGIHDRTKLMPYIVQKTTGYNPQVMEGYQNEEGDWVPGEYEKAAEEGRKINFQGAASLRDLRRQKDYLARYDEYLQEKSKIDEMNKELRQQWLPAEDFAEKQAEGGTPCPPGHIKVGNKCVPVGNQPTFQDSLDVYNMQMKQNAYYNKHKKFFNNTTIHKNPTAINIYAGNLSSGKNRKESIEALRKEYNLQKDRYSFYVTNGRVPAHMRGKQKEKWEKEVKKNIAESKKKMQQIRSAIAEHYPSSNHKHYYKDLVTGAIDPNAPTSYYHDQIQPQGLIERDANMNLPIHFDGIDVVTLYYDPLAIKPAKLLSDEEIKKRYEKYGESGIPQSRLKRLKLTEDPKKETKPQNKNVVNKPTEHQYPTSYKPVVDNTHQKPPEGKLMVGQEEVQQLDPKTGTVTTVINPIYEESMKPIPTLHPTHVDNTLRKFVGPPPEISEEEVIEDDEDTTYEEDLGEPGPGGHWEDNVSRYIDWNGNSVGYNLPRFRKPGHGGDLIRKGKRRYIHFPSIEKRYDAWIEPDEEYATGGEYNLGDEVELTEAEVKRLRSLGYTIEQI